MLPAVALRGRRFRAAMSGEDESTESLDASVSRRSLYLMLFRLLFTDFEYLPD